MKYESLLDARNNKLIQLTIWLKNNNDEREHLKAEFIRISKVAGRQCMLVLHNGKIALFVNNMVKE